MRVISDPHLARKHLTNMLQCVPSYEYLWSAAWCFFNEGDPAAERWVHDKALAVLEGKAGIVAAAIRRKATRLGLDADKRAKRRPLPPTTYTTSAPTSTTPPP